MNLPKHNEQPNLIRELRLDPSLAPEQAVLMMGMLDRGFYEEEHAASKPAPVELPTEYVPDYLRREPYHGQ